jgi:hypothetical protein
MPMLVWTPPAGGPHGTAIEVRVAGDIYTFVDGQPKFVDVERVAAVTTALQAAVPGSTVTTPAGAQ